MEQQVTEAQTEYVRQELFVIFDGPSGPESGRFVELENGKGQGVGPVSTVAWDEVDGFHRLGPFYTEDDLAHERDHNKNLLKILEHIEAQHRDSWGNSTCGDCHTCVVARAAIAEAQE